MPPYFNKNLKQLNVICVHCISYAKRIQIQRVNQVFWGVNQLAFTNHRPGSVLINELANYYY